MKNQLFAVLAVTLLAAFNSQFSTAFAQGSLTPPGAPAPTMKSLDQIEARTAITNTAGVVTISQPGSYYLTHNIAVTSGDAIDITANDVTLDLNGFTLSSTETTPTGYGISLARSAGNAGNSDITIFNGHIKGGITNNGSGTYSGPGFGYGISYSSVAPLNVRVTGVLVSGCSFGIYLYTGNSTVVESCMVLNAVATGINASFVSHSTANLCGAFGIDADNASDCFGQGAADGLTLNNTANNCDGSGGTGVGVAAGTANNCHGTSSAGTGLGATTANNCYGTSGGGGYGLNATTANNCYGTSATYIGLNATTALNCFGYCTSGGIGLYATGSATGCYGQSPTGTGIKAVIANSCVIGSGTVTITYKYNMP